MTITGARIALGPVRSARRDFRIHDGQIRFDRADEPPKKGLDLSGFLVMPGLINAHDHLEFNLFPRLGNGRYSNAKEWADDIYRPLDSPVKEQLALPKRARLMWGGLKNLMSGVTTVAHHNPVEEAGFDEAFPVNVVRNFGWAHSLDFSPDLADRFRATPADWPFLVHAAEGIDERARAEIDRLDRMGVLCDRTALIHAIGLDAAGLDLLKARRSGIVWCPSSNLSVYGRTLPLAAFNGGVNIALGTDSAMTAQTDLIGEIGVARRIANLNPDDLYEMATTRAARLLRLQEGQGAIRDGGVADLVAVEDREQTPAAALEEMTPELVMVRGVIRLITARLSDRVENPPKLQPVALEGRGQWLTDIDIASLHNETVRALGADFRLAGKRLWS